MAMEKQVSSSVASSLLIAAAAEDYNKSTLVHSFLDITVGQSVDIAEFFLNASNWQLDQALQIFYVANGNDAEVAPPLPAYTDVLNGHGTHDPEPRSTSSSIWESDSTITTTATTTTLSSLYQPPTALLFAGSFHTAMDEAKKQNKWLLVNVQSRMDFSSHMLNRDIWSNEIVAETIRSYLIFWQVDEDSIHGMKVCTYYNVSSFPVILVIDPVTGEKKKTWKGSIEAYSLLEDLLPFCDHGPCDQYMYKSHGENVSVASLLEDEQEEEKMENPKDLIEYDSASSLIEYPSLPDEPEGSDDNQCKVMIRLPDGKKVERRFHKFDPVQYLWSFSNSHLKEEQRNLPFRLIQAIPGAKRTFQLDQKMTFDEAGISRAMLSLSFV